VLFARVFAGFAATVATKDLPAVQTLGLRVDPVSRFYPAQVEAKSAPGVRPLPTKVRGGRIAILDAFARPRPRPRTSRTARAFADIVGATGGPPDSAERAGLRLTGVIHGELPAATIMAIRAAGSQPLETGKFEVFATTDQLIAALERVVDPNQNGDASDAVPVALTGLSAPYSGFAHSVAAQAVDAAADLGTLVVAPAGNGGQSGGRYGTIADPGAAAGALTVGALDGTGRVAAASSRGPTYDLTPKPDLAIGGGAKTGFGTAWGTAVAAARVAGVAAALRAERPKLDPRETAAALVGTAAARGPLFAAGGGDPLLQAARVTPLVADPAAVLLTPGTPAVMRFPAFVRVRNVGSRSYPLHGKLLRPRRAARVRVQQARELAGRLQVGPIAIPWQLGGPPPAPPVGRLHLVRRNGKPDGVRFTAGSIKRGKKGQSVIPVGNLVLTLEGPGKRELTPPGGARDLLPSEYAYTLTPEVLGSLPPGRYRFVLRVRGRPGIPAVARHSKPFRIG
jgi:hypothetical protein